MSAAVVSGTVADLLDDHSRLGPDDVKALLRNTAYRVPGLSDTAAAGTGGLDLAAAMTAAKAQKKGKRSRTSETAPGDPATWRALAKAIDRGDAVKAQKAWDALGLAARSWAARSWASLDPASQDWVARSWAARSWAARSWAGDDWAARSWAARSWAGDDWAARSWAGDDWAARSWAARSWAARSWAAIWQ